MKIIFNAKMTRQAPHSSCALLLGALLLVAPPLLSTAVAGSTEPNPKALSKAAQESLSDQKVAQKELNALMYKLAKDAKFAKEFDMAVFKKDEPQIISLMKEGGIKQSSVKIEKIESDLKITFWINFKKGTAGGSISW